MTSNQMKALVKAKPEEGLWMERVPVPEIGPDDVLIKIKATGICGTDIHIWNWDDWAQKTVPVPLVTGHEFAGEIVEIGRTEDVYRNPQHPYTRGNIGVARHRVRQIGTAHDLFQIHRARQRIAQAIKVLLLLDRRNAYLVLNDGLCAHIHTRPGLIAIGYEGNAQPTQSADRPGDTQCQPAAVPHSMQRDQQFVIKARH